MYRSKLSVKQQDELTITQKELLTLLEESQPSSWLKVRKSMLRIFQIVPELPYLFISEIKCAIKKITNILTLLTIYGQDIPQLSRSNYFREQFITIKKKDRVYQSTIKWVTEQDKETVEKTVQIIVQTLSTFFEKEMKTINQQDCWFLLYFFNKYQLKSDKQITFFMNFNSKLQKIDVIINDSRYLKEQAIMKCICQVLQKNQGQGNLGVLFDEALIGSSSTKNIYKFCNIYSTYLLNLSAQKLERIFKQLCRIGINNLILQFIYRTSMMLANEQQFYKLAYLYEKIVLPVVALRAKACRKYNVQTLALKITEFYFFGFFTFYYKLQKSALDCIIQNIQHIKSKQVQARWVSLCHKTVEKNSSLKNILKQQLSSKGLINLELQIHSMPEYDVWEITNRNIRKLKQYAYQPSNLKGIVNQANQCYIISIVQALFMNKNLKRIIEKARPKYSGVRAVDCLNEIFDQLQNSSLILPNVKDLKAFGPKYFDRSERQEDAQNYLIYLMEQLQNQLKKQNLLEDFRQTFEIKTNDTIECKDCKNHKKLEDCSQYVHTFSHGQKFFLERNEELIDYKCEKCQKKHCKKTTTIQLTGQIAILHINRFSFSGGTSKKQLPTQQIKRKINDHQLVGMVFHIGKTIQSGHYTYFSRVGKKRWTEMNDQEVNEFNLDYEDQQFQKQFKEEKTPYILFYKKGGQVK